MKELSAKDKQRILDSIRSIKDYPKEGIIFRDITTLLNDAKMFEFLMQHLEDYYKDEPIDFVAGIESRGFIFGSALATRLKLPFVLVRKPGKLPYKIVSEKYELEYGTDEVQMHVDSFDKSKRKNVLLIDDLLATGGTAKASINIIRKIGANCIGACFVLNLVALNGVKEIDTTVYSVIDID